MTRTPCSCTATVAAECYHRLGSIAEPEPDCLARHTYATLERFVAVDEPDAVPLATGDDGGAVIPAAGLIVVYGNGGAGKTTALVDMAMHLSAGLRWLGLVGADRPARVAWVENEGPRPEFRKRLGAKLAAWDGPSIAGRVHVYEDPWEQFTFRDETARDRLVELVNDELIDIVIAGPVKAIGMKGAGTDDDIAEFLTYVKDVRDRCGAAIVLVHHENRAGQISGAWESRPDTLLHVQAQGHGRTRLYWQKVRWCSALHLTSTSLLWADGYGFTVEAREEITDESIVEGIFAAVDEQPGRSWSKIRDSEHVHGKAEDLARVRDRLLATGELVNTAAREGYFNLWRSDDPAATRSQTGTASERLPFPPPERAGNDEPFPVPPFYRNGGGNGTAPDRGHDDAEPVDDEAAARWAWMASNEPDLEGQT